MHFWENWDIIILSDRKIEILLILKIVKDKNYFLLQFFESLFFKTLRSRVSEFLNLIASIKLSSFCKA